MIELVWDTARVGTATSSHGATLTVGDRPAFSPDDLLAAAVASCVMRRFLQLAIDADQPVLSYAATAGVDDACESTDPPRVIVHVYVLAPAGADTPRLAQLIAESAQSSPIAKGLAFQPIVTSDVRVLCASDGGLT